MAEMVDAIDLESISLAGECGFESRRPQCFEPSYIIQHAEEKGHTKEARTEARHAKN